MPIDGSKFADEFTRLRESYEENRLAETLNAIVYGPKGTGKTTFASTGPQPILFHMFDPGGEKSVRDKLSGEDRVFVDIRFSQEDPWKPTAFRAWEKEFERLEKLGFFDSVRTYVLDSATTWSDACMNAIVAARGKPGAKPEWNDYHMQQIIMRDWMKRMLALPCNVILTGHIDTEKDEISGQLFKDVLFTGKLKVKIPILFDEVYMTQAKESSSGRKFTIITQPCDRFSACTRLGVNGRFDVVEEPNLKNLLKKAGLPCEDLPA